MNIMPHCHPDHPPPPDVPAQLADPPPPHPLDGSHPYTLVLVSHLDGEVRSDSNL